MPSITDLLDRVERLLLRHEELQRTNALLQEQLQAVGHERDQLRSRLSAARQRIDALLDNTGGVVEAAEGSVVWLGPDVLLSAGADPTIADRDGVTAEEHAVQRGQHAVVEVFERHRTR